MIRSIDPSNASAMQRREMKRQYKLHQKRIRSMKADIDCKKPRSRQRRASAWTYCRRVERQRQIQQDNQHLLDRLVDIAKKQPKQPEQAARIHAQKSHERRRAIERKRVEEENVKIRNRLTQLMTKKSHDTKQWERERAEQQKRLQRQRERRFALSRRRKRGTKLHQSLAKLPPTENASEWRHLLENMKSEIVVAASTTPNSDEKASA